MAYLERIKVLEVDHSALSVVSCRINLHINSMSGKCMLHHPILIGQTINKTQKNPGGDVCDC